MTAGVNHPEHIGKAVLAVPEQRRVKMVGAGRTIGGDLANIGLLIWTIVAPTLICAFFGRWLDLDSGSGMLWTLSLSGTGLVAGFLMVWRSVRHGGFASAHFHNVDSAQSDRDHGLGQKR